MAKTALNDLKLGLFVLAGLALLVFSLYMIGQNRQLFSDSFVLKARFRNVDGLVSGNNVRYSGIQAGTVKSIRIIDDTTIEVLMHLDESMRQHIRENSLVSIGSEGLMGNKVVNIVPNELPAPQAEEGDILESRRQVAIADAVETLYRTNDNAAVISEELIRTIRRINNSPGLWRILGDTTVAENVDVALVSVREAAVHINNTAMLLETVAGDVQRGKGVAGLLLSDSSSAGKLRSAINDIQAAGAGADRLMLRLDSISETLQHGFDDKGSLVHTLLRDSSLAGQLRRSADHVEQGTAAFREDMEALRHNFLFRSYFRRKAREK